MDFSWDDRKNESNFRKHRVWFEEALTVFFDPFSESVSEYHPKEQRWITIGHSSEQRLLLVVHFEKEEERVRIISARPLTPKERRDYEKGI